MTPNVSQAEWEAFKARKARASVQPVKRKAPTPKEREIQRAILDYLKVVPGVVAWRNNVGGMVGEHKGKRWAVRFGFPGLSDIGGWATKRYWCLECGARAESCNEWQRAGKVACCPECKHATYPVPLYIEVKRPGTYPTAEQQAFLDQVKAAGGIAIVARSVEDVRVALVGP